MSNDQEFVSRRQVIQAAVLSGIGAVLPAAVLAASENNKPSLRSKPIPSSGQEIPVIGLGANQFGKLSVEAASSLLKRMHELGGRVIDTAARYGESEVILGQALKQSKLTEQMFIATKFDAPGTAPDAPGGKDSVERSLQRLGKIDLLFAHRLESVESMMPVMLDLKQQGRVKYIGFTCVAQASYPKVIEYLRKYPVDFLQVNYSIDDRAADAEVLPLAQERKVAVMLATPLGGRKPLLSRVQGRELPEWAAVFGAKSWSQFLLKWAVSHPAVTCAIPGSTKLEHLEDNQSAGRGHLPHLDMRERMAAFWDSIAA